MNTAEIRTLYAYNRWANSRMLDALHGLPWPDVTREVRTSHGSIRGTLVHTLWAEWIWLRRWLGESPKLRFSPEEFPDLGAIESRWAELERERQKFLERLTDELLKTRIAYENLQGIRWEYSLNHMMQHVANHSSYHRGQLVTLLRQLGHQPPATDFLLFFDESSSRA